MEYIDLSHKLINNLEVFPGDPEFKLNNFKVPDENDSSLISKISACLHSGTHIDSPLHYIKNTNNILNLKLDNLIGKSSIIQYKNNEKEIHIEKFENPLEKIVILNTTWCNNWGSDKYFIENPYLSKEFAETLIEKNINGLAIDTPSVDKFGKSTIHKILLKNNIWIVENLTNTNRIVKNKYYAYFIPINIDAEASFVRAFLKK
ncbi:MAG: cyclase family protein [Methanobacteriaceae archaeon]|jgi:kynurenine formamidase|nr:cyclase family protein [Methanobacteriaceae archaeon]